VRALVEDRLLAIDAAGSWEPAIPAPARRLGARVARGERITALVAAAGNAWVLGNRLRVEEPVLEAHAQYRAAMSGKPRFLPRLF